MVGHYNYFDDTYWVPSQAASWDSGNSRWIIGSGSNQGILTELGTWNEGFRPANIKIDFTISSWPGGSSWNIYLREAGGIIIAELGSAVVTAAGNYTWDVPIDWAGHVDLSTLIFSDSTYVDNYITAIEFYD